MTTFAIKVTCNLHIDLGSQESHFVNGRYDQTKTAINSETKNVCDSQIFILKTINAYYDNMSILSALLQTIIIPIKESRIAKQKNNCYHISHKNNLTNKFINIQIIDIDDSKEKEIIKNTIKKEYDSQFELFIALNEYCYDYIDIASYISKNELVRFIKQYITRTLKNATFPYLFPNVELCSLHDLTQCANEINFDDDMVWKSLVDIYIRETNKNQKLANSKTEDYKMFSKFAAIKKYYGSNQPKQRINDQTNNR